MSFEQNLSAKSDKNRIIIIFFWGGGDVKFDSPKLIWSWKWIGCAKKFDFSCDVNMMVHAEVMETCGESLNIEQQFGEQMQQACTCMQKALGKSEEEFPCETMEGGNRLKYLWSTWFDAIWCDRMRNCLKSLKISSLLWFLKFRLNKRNSAKNSTKKKNFCVKFFLCAKISWKFGPQTEFGSNSHKFDFIFCEFFLVFISFLPWFSDFKQKRREFRHFVKYFAW